MATLRRFLREGTPWRGLIATEDQASGSTLRRCLRRWVETGLKVGAPGFQGLSGVRAHETAEAG